MHNRRIPRHVETAWHALPHVFRETHPLPKTGVDHAAWLQSLREDSEHAACAILDAATAYMARGQLEDGRAISVEAKPFREVMRAIDQHARTKEKQR